MNYVYPIDDKADGHFDIYKHDFWDYPWPQALGRCWFLDYRVLLGVPGISTPRVPLVKTCYLKIVCLLSHTCYFKIAHLLFFIGTLETATKSKIAMKNCCGVSVSSVLDRVYESHCNLWKRYLNWLRYLSFTRGEVFCVSIGSFWRCISNTVLLNKLVLKY